MINPTYSVSNFVTIAINCTNKIFTLASEDNNIPQEQSFTFISAKISNYKNRYGMDTCNSSIRNQAQQETPTTSSFSLNYVNKNATSLINPAFILKHIITISGVGYTLNCTAKSIQHFSKGNYKQCILHATAGAITAIMTYTCFNKLS